MSISIDHAFTFFFVGTCYGVGRFVMESGAKGCEVWTKAVSFHLTLLGCTNMVEWILPKLRAQRAKSMKFKDGYMISSGQPVKEYISAAVPHVLLRQVSSSTILALMCFRYLYLFFVFPFFRVLLGLRSKITLDWDPKGKQGPKAPLTWSGHRPPTQRGLHQIRPPVVATESLKYKLALSLLRVLFPHAHAIFFFFLSIY